MKVVMNIIQMVQREKLNAAVSHLADFEPESMIHRKLEQGKCSCDKYFSAIVREALGIFLQSTSNLWKFRKSWSSVAFCRFEVETNMYSIS